MQNIILLLYYVIFLHFTFKSAVYVHMCDYEKMHIQKCLGIPLKFSTLKLEKTLSCLYVILNLSKVFL